MGEAAEFDPTKPSEYDANGKAVCRIYRYDDEKRCYCEIHRRDIRVGDRIVCVGINGDRLFMAQAATVKELVPPVDGNGGGYVPDPDHPADFLIGG